MYVILKNFIFFLRLKKYGEMLLKILFFGLFLFLDNKYLLCVFCRIGIRDEKLKKKKKGCMFCFVKKIIIYGGKYI